MKKLLFLTAIGIGFILGSRAGRGPYEKLEARVQDFLGRPEVHDRFDTAKGAATQRFGTAKGAATERFGTAKGAATQHFGTAKGAASQQLSGIKSRFPSSRNGHTTPAEPTEPGSPATEAPTTEAPITEAAAPDPSAPPAPPATPTQSEGYSDSVLQANGTADLTQGNE